MNSPSIADQGLRPFEVVVASISGAQRWSKTTVYSENWEENEEVKKEPAFGEARNNEWEKKREAQIHFLRMTRNSFNRYGCRNRNSGGTAKSAQPSSRQLTSMVIDGFWLISGCKCGSWKRVHENQFAIEIQWRGPIPVVQQGAAASRPDSWLSTMAVSIPLSFRHECRSIFKSRRMKSRKLESVTGKIH